MRQFLCLLALAAALAPRPGVAAPLRGPYEYPGAVSFSTKLGLQLGLGGYTPGGFKILVNYSHRFARSRDGVVGVWSLIDLGFIVGPGIAVCGPTGMVWECGPVGYGSAIELKGGIQLTFRTPVPIVPYVKLGAALAGVFARDRCEDTGVGVPLAAVGGGARYFFARNWAVSLGAELVLGPAFYSAGKDCFPGGHNEFWRAAAFLASLHYAL